MSTSLSAAKEVELLREGKTVPPETLYLNRAGRKFVIDLSCGALKGYLLDRYTCKPTKPATTATEPKPGQTEEQAAAARIEAGKQA